VIVSELRPIFRVWGGMQRFDVGKILKADPLLLGGIVAYVLVATWKVLPFEGLCSPLARVLRFPLAFALATSALFTVLRKGVGVKYYYVTKYQVWACILLSFALVILVAHLASVLVRWSSLLRPAVWLRVALVASLLATVPNLWAKTFIGYRTSLLERTLPHGPPYKRLHALADVEAIARIKAALSTEHKQFGGYLTTFFPRFSFMNATLGYHPGGQDFFSPVTDPGYCVFWVAKEQDLQVLGLTQKLDAHRRRVDAAGGTCAEYPVPWKTTPQSLCYHCY
jgi:hypothetical protein